MSKPECPKNDDVTVVKRALADPRYFECVVQNWEARLTRFVRRYSGMSTEESQDLLQEVFLKVYRHLNDFDPALTFSSWIYRITRNEMISRWRRPSPTPDAQDIHDEMWEIPESLRDEFTGELHVERGELSLALRQILDQLAPRDREILVLRFLEEKEYAEISDILQMPAGSVATLIHRAREKFRRAAIAQGLAPERKE
jgi:RNA polymerase sigma-70 factor (ECF subfamily)